MKRTPSILSTAVLTSVTNSVEDEFEAGLEGIQTMQIKRKRKAILKSLSMYTNEEVFEKLKECEKKTRFLNTENNIIDKYYEDKFHTTASDGSEESGSFYGSVTKSTPASPSPFPSPMVGRKVYTMTFEQKLTVARYYMMVIREEARNLRKTTQNFIALCLATIDNYKESLVEISMERRELEIQFNSFLQTKKTVPFLHKWQKFVLTRETKRESMICLLKLRNISFMNKIKNQILIKKYRDEVDPIEFYSKWTEKAALVEEVSNLSKQKSRLRRAIVPIERYTYEKKQELEKVAKKRDELRKKIQREKHSLNYLVNKENCDDGFSQQEQERHDKLKYMIENYTVPSIMEYILLVKNNKEARDLIIKWKQKVRVAEMVYRGEVRKWKNISNVRHNITHPNILMI